MFIFWMSFRTMPDPSLLPQGGRKCASLTLYEDAPCSVVQWFDSYPSPVEKSPSLLLVGVLFLYLCYSGSLSNLCTFNDSYYWTNMAGFVLVKCLALLLKDIKSKVIEELAWTKRNIDVLRIKKKLSEESTWQIKNETQST